MALVGVGIAIFGVVQKLGGETALAWIWDPERRDPGNNFATFRYRANAGAFLNLVLPLVAGCTWLGFRKGSRLGRTGWVAGLFLVAVGIQSNPSRASWAIALGLGVVLGTSVAWRSWRKHGSERRTLVIYGVVTLLAMSALAVVSGLGRWETSWSRFATQGFRLADRSPTMIYLKMAGDSGPLGFGPGTFHSVFPQYQRSYDFHGREVPAFWTKNYWPQAHQDYLQATIEWGWVGVAVWGWLIFGGIACGVAGYRRARRAETRWPLFCSLLAIGGVLIHCLVDFPLQIASIQLYFCVLLGACWGAGKTEELAAGKAGNETEPALGSPESRSVKATCRRISSRRRTASASPADFAKR